jgi:arylsulfatase
MPHVPIEVSSKFKGKSGAGMYGDLMMEIDWSVGEIMKALKQNGLEENTLVVFSSDNGPWLNYGNHAGNTGGFREGKGTVYEGGHRVPGIMRWKGKTASGVVYNQMASTIDIFPTIAEIIGAELPKHKIDGVSLLPLLTDSPNASPRDEFYYYYNRNSLKAVRKGNWKLVFAHKGRSYVGSQPGNDGFPGPSPENIPFEQGLYDLRRDPGETYDVSETYPEKLAELMVLAEKARKDLGDDLTNREGTGRRPIGTVE